MIGAIQCDESFGVFGRRENRGRIFYSHGGIARRMQNQKCSPQIGQRLL